MLVAEDTYQPDDEYIKRIASEMTPCFGLQFDLSDETCQGCRLSGSCQRKFFVRLGEAARIVEKSETTVVDDVAERTETLADQISGATKEKITEFEAFADSECCICGKDIEQGTTAKYNIRLGLWHVTCHDDYLKGVRAKSS